MLALQKNPAITLLRSALLSPIHEGMMMEGSGGNRYGDWSKITDELFDDIAQRLDITSVV
jgi:hypothetical protein